MRRFTKNASALNMKAFIRGVWNGKDVKDQVDTPDSKDSSLEEEQVTDVDYDARKEDIESMGSRGPTVQFDNLTVKVKKTKRIVLDGVSGSIKKGTCVALMGPSGAGKSTMLDALAGRSSKHNLNISGKVLIDGRKLSSETKSRVSYVCQEDILPVTQTVYEAISDSAALRLPKSMSAKKKKERVEEVLAALSLEKCKNTMIGGVGKRGVSGGERKRVAIGLELITNPNVLFLDEPTSGLDSATALFVMKSILSLCDQGKTVICTIHQPRSQLFQLFREVMILGGGGIVYYGPAKDATGYFASMTPPLVCPEQTNPADFLLDILTDENGHQSAKQVQPLLEAYKEQLSIASHDSNGEVIPVTYKKEKKPQGSSFFTQLYVLSRRLAKTSYRDKMILFMEVLQFIFLAILTGLMYLRLEYNQDGARDFMASIYFALVNVTFVSVVTVVTVFPQERHLFNRERSAGAYGVIPYFLSHCAIDFPKQTIYSLLYSVPVYIMVGFENDALKFAWFLAFFVLSLQVASAMALCVSAAVPNVNMGNLVAGVLLVIFMSFGGFFISSTPVYFKPIEWISPYTYAYRGVLLNQFKNSSQTFACENAEGCLFTDGNSLIRAAGYENANMYTDFAVLFAMFVIYRIITLFTLKYVPVGKN